MPYAQPALDDDVVRYVGEPVAMVLADSAELTEDAAQAVGLDLEHARPGPRKWPNAAYCKFGDSMNAKTDQALLNRWHRRKNYSAIQ